MEKATPSISVIIPSYNYGHYLEDAITSVINQRIRHIQIIVVDDGSTDDTQQVVSKYGEKIEYYFQHNKGLSEARNTGIKYAQGKYIQFLDADDMLGDNALQGRMNYLDRNLHCDIAVCRNHFFTHTKYFRPAKIYSSGWPLFPSRLDVHLHFLNIAPPHAYLVRRPVIEAVGAFDSNMKVCEDYDYWIRAIRSGFNIEYCRQGSVYYRRHDSNMSHDKVRQYEYDCKIHAKIMGFLERQPQKDACLEKLVASLAGTIFLAARLQGAELGGGCNLDAQYHSILDLLEEYARYEPVTWNPLSQLYYLRCLYELDRMADHSAVIIHDTGRIHAVFSSLGGHDSRWVRTLQYLMKGQELGWLGRYRLLRYAAGL